MGDFRVYDVKSLSRLNREDLLVSRFAEHLRSHEHLREAHKHTFYHVMLFTEGAGYHTIDLHRFPVRPYQMYFMVPGQLHSWDFEGHVDGFVLNFSSSFLDSLLLKTDYLEQFPFFNGSVHRSVVELPENIRTEIVGLFERLVSEIERPALMGVDMLQAMMLQLFIQVGRLSFDKSPGAASPQGLGTLRNFHKLIEQHYKEFRLPKAYAEMLFITPNHLNALCKNAYRLSAGEVIRNRITLEARRLLSNKELTVSEISYQLNFTDNSYFSKFYKKHTGLSPEEFRKQLD